MNEVKSEDHQQHRTLHRAAYLLDIHKASEDQAVDPCLGVGILVALGDAYLGALGHDTEHVGHHGSVDVELGAWEVDDD